MRSPVHSARSFWPLADRVLWQALVTPAAGLLDDAGALSHLRPASLNIISVCYGCWLAWLTEAVPGALDEPPVERATPERLLAWVGSLTNLAPMSRALRLDGVLRLITAAAPDACCWFSSARARLRREATHDHGIPQAGALLLSARSASRPGSTCGPRGR
jgi:hypothetical protein